ncbi:MAG TPA: hypothetical protein VGE93_06385 [Bryobacteraceae bacterium]
MPQLELRGIIAVGLWQILTTIWAIFMAGMVTDMWFRVEYTRRTTNAIHDSQRVLYVMSMHALKHTCPKAEAHVMQDIKGLADILNKEAVK